MEATRTMFSDVDRFIILGQVRNATNLLESRIKHEPTDRDSWIKLMAIYRDEGMEGGFNRTYAAFREQFGTSAGA
jgi:DNA-binding SARP family transcriptional activator